MALVQVREVFRVGLLQKVARYVSPPNPNSTTSFLWRADSFSLQKRNLMLARMREFKSSFFSTTQVSSPPAGTATAAAEIHTSPVLQAEAEAENEEISSSNVSSAGMSKGETDESLFDRNYGEEQSDHHKVAESTLDHHMSTAEDEPENLANTGFDISKMSKPKGGE